MSTEDACREEGMPSRRSATKIGMDSEEKKER